MPKSKFLPLATSMLIFGLATATAVAASDNLKTQDHNSATMNHNQMNKTAKTNDVLPKEPGQGAFATIAEIVELLNSAPNTDWSKVNINALREHLIDMNEVTLRAKAGTKITGNSITFTVSGSGRAKQAIQAMVPAHAAFLPTDWKAKGEIIDKGATLTVHAANPNELAKLKALGFFGIMATGAHHQTHHMAMAKGESNVHAHN